MKTLLSLVLISLCITSFSQNRSIQFETKTFEEIKSIAKSQNKLIFLDAYTSWCGPCKFMAKNIFTNDTVADFYNARFINAKIDMEKGEGIELAKKYQVRCYPNLLYINGDGEIVHRVGGMRKTGDFVQLGQTAIDGKETYKEFSKTFKIEQGNSEFLRNYITYLASTCLPVDSLLTTYFNLQSNDALYSSENWKMIYKYVKNYTSKEFQFLVENKEKFSQLYTKDSVDSKINDVYYSFGRSLIYSKTPKTVELENYIVSLEKMSIAATKKTALYLRLENAQKNKDWKLFSQLLTKSNIQLVDEEKINSIAWTLYENVDDETTLSKMAEQMNEMLKSKKELKFFAEYDTYASLLYKLKRKKEALNAATTAIEHAKAMNLNPEDYSATNELISKINALK
jgi:thiol-disulfide isomerase/thioredoxin